MMQNAEYYDLCATLKATSLVPDTCLSIVLGGSVARGWQHTKSDTDLYLVSTDGWRGDSNGFNAVALDPDRVPTNVLHVGDRKVEIRFWTDDQVDQMFRKISWDRFHQADPFGQQISDVEAAFLGRIATAIAVTGPDWLQRRRDQLADSAFRSSFAVRALSIADSYVEDALGMLEARDLHSAVLATQCAVAASADALTINLGEYSFEDKWRARRLQLLQPPVLSFERFWELTTMKSFDPQAPERWISEALEVCRQAALEVEI